MEISLSARALDSGGVEYGHLAGGRLAPGDRQLTHVLLWQGRSAQLLLPVAELSAGQPGIVWLRRSLEEVTDMELLPSTATASRSRAVPEQPVRKGVDPSAPNASGDVTSPSIPVQKTLRPDARVNARDGVVGHLLRLGIQPRTGQITHLVACVRHFFREREVKFDWNLVERVEGGAIYLKVNKNDVGQP